MEQAKPIEPLKILIVHNKYLQSGGEDSVVQNEIDILSRNDYSVHYQEFSNTPFLKTGFGWLTLPFTIFFNISAFFKIRKLVKKHRIGVVHVHNFFYNASPSVFWAAHSAGAKTIVTLHNYRLFCLNGIFFRAGKICFDCHTNRSFRKGISEKCFKSSKIFSSALAGSTLFHRKIGTWTKRVDKFIVINPFMPQLLSDIGIPDHKIVVKRNVLPENPFHPVMNYTNRKDYYLYVGRLNAEKGVEHLVAAFRQSGKKLVIIGGGELASMVQENISSNIEYAGAKTKEEVFRLYSECKALIFPSLWIEGMPMTIIEALSTGTIPIVAASVNTEMMIESGKNGFLYESGNIDDLNKVIAIFESKNTDELNRLSANAYSEYLATYSANNQMKFINEIYQF